MQATQEEYGERKKMNCGNEVVEIVGERKEKKRIKAIELPKLRGEKKKLWQLSC